MGPGAEARTALAAIVQGARAHDAESAILDFKTVGRSVKDTLVNLAEAAACFANARGGEVVVGVKDKSRDADALAGTDLDEVRVQRRIFDLTEPSLVVTVTDEHWGSPARRYYGAS